MSGGAVSASEEMQRVTLRWLPAVTWTLATAYAGLVIRRSRRRFRRWEDREQESAEQATDRQTRRPRSRLIKVVRFVLALVLLPMFLVLAALCGGWHHDGRVYVWVHRRGHLPRPTWAGAVRIIVFLAPGAVFVVASAKAGARVTLVLLELFGPVVLGAAVLLLRAIKRGTIRGSVPADWTIESAASRLRYGGMSIIARHVETLAGPSESIAATAASGELARIYRGWRFRMQDVPGRPLQLFRPGTTTPAP